jgi:O-antigen/teichoic acid export membrane protein
VAVNDSVRRYRAVLLGGGGLALAKGINLLSVLITVPLTLEYLGTERYGLWVTLSSLITLLSFADLGIGNGLVTAVAKADGEQDFAAIRRLVSSAFFLLSAIGGGVALLTCALYPLVPWGAVFAVTDPLAVAEAGPAMLVFMLVFALNLPLGVVQRVQMGLQETWLFSLWQAAGYAGAMGGVLLVIHAKAGLPWLVLAMLGIPAVCQLCNFGVEFFCRRPALRPRLGAFHKGTLRAVLSVGLLFFALQVLNILANFSDSLFLSHLLGQGAVATYGVTYKVYQVLLLATIFLQPLWPAFGEALGRRDYAWASTALSRILVGSLALGGVLGLALWLYGQKIIALWVGGAVLPEPPLIAAFAAWVVLASYGGAISVFLNNEAFLQKQLLIYALGSLVALALKMPFILWWGTAGAVWATVVGYTVFFSVPAVVIAYRTLAALARDEKRMDGRVLTSE